MINNETEIWLCCKGRPKRTHALYTGSKVTFCGRVLDRGRDEHIPGAYLPTCDHCRDTMVPREETAA